VLGDFPPSTFFGSRFSRRGSYFCGKLRLVIQCLLAINGLKEFIALSGQARDENIPVSLVIVDYQDVRANHFGYTLGERSPRSPLAFTEGYFHVS
jgi:hypothetical protein